MKIRERIEQWENERTQLQQTIAELTERMDSLMDKLGESPHVQKLQTEMAELREMLAKANSDLTEANNQLATLKQTLQKHGPTDDTNPVAPAPNAKPGDKSDPPAEPPQKKPRARAAKPQEREWF